MKWRPIIFSAPMVRALIEGRKTQTRRVMNPQPHDSDFRDDDTIRGHFCQYGLPGDKLWVREAFRYSADGDGVIYRSDAEDLPGTWRSPFHLPKKYSRITLEVKSIRVERLQDIGGADCVDEGMQGEAILLKERFAATWNDMHSEYEKSWHSNPWVWVVKFEVLR